MASKEKSAKTDPVETKSSELLVEKISTRAELQDILAVIAKKTVESNSTYMHSMILLDRVLRMPNASQLFDSDLKEQAKDLWLKLKSSGIQLNDPPFLFGVPKSEGQESDEA